MTSVPWLTVLWLAPAVGAIAVALLPAGPARARLAQQIGLVVSVAVLGWSIAMAVTFDAHTASAQPLLDAAGVTPDDGFFELTASAPNDFVTALSALRFWDRDVQP